MEKSVAAILFLTNALSSFAQFAPPVGQVGTTAIYTDSSVFTGWASGCTVVRGPEDISNPGLGYASAGDSTMALGKAGANGTVSLGDGGYAILTFNQPVKNGPGWDFAVFENAFDDTYLELGFVEVSSDGITYYRFPATSNTQDTMQVATFGNLDATKLNNLGGKYRALYGTPFDLQELSGERGLNTDSITHIKVVDVIGCIQNAYASYDQNGHKVNDPWNTPFATGGFDLDAVGIIHQSETGVENYTKEILKCSVFPNPVTENSVLQYYTDKPLDVKIEIADLLGNSLRMLPEKKTEKGWQVISLNSIQLNPGVYFINLITNEGITAKKIIINE